MVSLDAAKVFDKLWRSGLFYKLIGKMDQGIWKLLFSYYSESYVIVCSEGKKSEKFKTTGVKQGGILSPFLFNFFINDLLEEILAMEIGARVGKYNTSIIAYCDGLLLLSLNEMQMNKLLACCNNVNEKWNLILPNLFLSV